MHRLTGYYQHSPIEEEKTGHLAGTETHHRAVGVRSIHADTVLGNACLRSRNIGESCPRGSYLCSCTFPLHSACIVGRAVVFGFGWFDSITEGTQRESRSAMTKDQLARVEAGIPGRPPSVVSVRGLRMSYGSLEAVAGIDLDVFPGEVFAFLGPNGAGKTTTVEILEGFRHRTGGEVSVLGVDPGKADAVWRSRIGVVLQESEPEAALTVRECLSLYAGYYPAPRAVEDTLELVELLEKAGERCAHLSGGQRRRLDVALALIGDPELLFLDEPTTGFDPSARRTAWDVIAGLRALGKTIFLTTHYMEEAEYLADRIAVIAAGKIVAEGTPNTLGARDVQKSVVRFTLPPGLELTDLPSEIHSLAVLEPAGVVELRTEKLLPLLRPLVAWGERVGADLADLTVSRPSLEDTYLQLTREEGR
jgi:ABC-2 type transport system ATP-binding protein